ncbi:MAG: TonB-dependent receptor [Sediminicola sp.]
MSGKLVDKGNQLPLTTVVLEIDGLDVGKSNADGTFTINWTPGEFVLVLSSPDHVPKKLPLVLTETDLELGTIYMERDITLEQADNLISLTAPDMGEEEDISVSSGLLQATRDVFLSRAAFDFGQAFFRVRGYDSKNGTVMINGVAMNGLLDGRPQWNHWGGLNDVTRNQEFSNGLQVSNYGFGGILGTSNINMLPSGLRPGTRISTSASNRTYRGRIMATHTSPNRSKGLHYTLSASRRWAGEGYMNGTNYDAYSLFGAMEYKFGPINSVALTAIGAFNKRGGSAALTQEVADLAGRKYNPYWGPLGDGAKNSRERNIAEPILMFNHYLKTGSFKLTTGVAYRFGEYARSRLGYYNAPNPDPTYYGYLPSYYINSPIGANFESAQMAREAFLREPQIQWEQLFMANGNRDPNEGAAYILYDDVVRNNHLMINTLSNMDMGEHFQMDAGLGYRQLKSDNHAKISDLLGAGFHRDMDTFSDTRNDVNGELQKYENDIFNYHYYMDAAVLEAFVQLRANYRKWEGSVSGNYTATSYQREGLFLNERFDDSYGKGEAVRFNALGAKAGLTYKLNGRHWLNVQGALIDRAPTIQNVFINPRENNQVVPHIQQENIFALDATYFLRLPALKGRVTGFYSRFMNVTDVNFFFVDSGVGSDFVQEVLTGMDHLHMGIECGLEYQVSAAVKLSGVANIGKYLYASDPFVSINFDTSGNGEEILDPGGSIDLGAAAIKDHRLAQGPQHAFALGVEYRDPKYWWVGATANYLARNYANISTISRTRSFYLDPETGAPFPEATEENVAKILEQRPMKDFYLLNLVGGKSWLVNNKYISVFISVNNLFDTLFRTGGYEQSRNGNYGQMVQDQKSGTPSFATKYWYGYGRTYFLNFAIGF